MFHENKSNLFLKCSYFDITSQQAALGQVLVLLHYALLKYEKRDYRVHMPCMSFWLPGTTIVVPK